MAPGCLGDLNDWARDVSPQTRLNKWCEDTDASGKDLQVGQYCVANCNLNGSEWKPGGKIRRTNHPIYGFEWEKKPGKWIQLKDNRIPFTKKRYCRHVK